MTLRPRSTLRQAASGHIHATLVAVAYLLVCLVGCSTARLLTHHPLPGFWTVERTVYDEPNESPEYQIYSVTRNVLQQRQDRSYRDRQYDTYDSQSEPRFTTMQPLNYLIGGLSILAALIIWSCCQPSRRWRREANSTETPQPQAVEPSADQQLRRKRSVLARVDELHRLKLTRTSSTVGRSQKKLHLDKLEGGTATGLAPRAQGESQFITAELNNPIENNRAATIFGVGFANSKWELGPVGSEGDEVPLSLEVNCGQVPAPDVISVDEPSSQQAALAQELPSTTETTSYPIHEGKKLSIVSVPEHEHAHHTHDHTSAVTPKGYQPTWEDSTCVICLEEWQPEDTVVKLACGHPLHRACALQWGEKQNHGEEVCPTCKQPMFDRGHVH